MSYKHGVSTREIATAIVAAAEASAGLPVVFGTAPVNLVSGKVPVNEPILAYNYAEATKKLGYSDDFDKYTICEFMSSHFSLFNVAPAVFINVLDPKIHKKAGETATLQVKDGEAVLETTDVLLDSIGIKNGDTAIEKEKYELEFDDKGHVHIFLTESVDTISVTFDVIDPTAVKSTDIIGGVSVDGEYKGLELINQVFPRFRLVPGQIVAPKFSTDSAVAAVMAAKSHSINGLFKATANIDISTKDITDYTKVAEHKNLKNLTSTYQKVYWPKVSLGGKQYHLGTQAASLTSFVHSLNDDIPYESASNKNLQADSAVLENGEEIFLGQDQAAYLNGQGIVTALNFIGGWKLWGVETGAYPAITDPKDRFIPVREMFNWVQNTLILTYWQKVDSPTNTKLIETVLDSINIWLNGLKSKGFLLGGRVEFLEPENSVTSLLDGKITFHLFITPPIPAKEIEFLVEFDVGYLNTLFAA